MHAIRAIAQGRTYLDTAISANASPTGARARNRSRRTIAGALSARETDVLKMIALGYSMKRMAAALELSPGTLETYKTRAMMKLELESRADIVRFALKQGWLNER